MLLRNKYLILALLTAAYTLSFMDRYVVNLLLNDIQRDLHLSEVQSGLLAGAGFAVLYALMAIPMGIWADRYQRAKIASIGVGLWSLMTGLCATAAGFAQLVLCRVGVGVGEAALTPAAYPMIRSLFSQRRLSTAIGVYCMGIYLGSGLAYWLGGYAMKAIRLHHLAGSFSFVNYDWQLLFLFFALPGLLVATLLFFVKVPQPATSSTGNSSSAFKAFLSQHQYRFLKLTFASALFNVAVYAAGVWLPAYLQRVHHMDLAASGTVLGISMICISPVGAVLGGIISDQLAKSQGIKGRMIAMLFTIALAGVSFLSILYCSSMTGTLIALGFLSLTLSMPVAITAAMVQDICPDELRSTAPAFMLMLQNLIGMSLGPALVAMLTQYVFRDSMSIGTSIAIVGGVFSLIAVLFISHLIKQTK